MWQFLLCLNWLVTCFRFQNIFWKNISCFWLWWKTYTNCCTNNYICNITCQKTFFTCSLWLIKCFQFQDVIWEKGRMLCKQKYWIKNMMVLHKNSNFDFVLLLQAVYYPFLFLRHLIFFHFLTNVTILYFGCPIGIPGPFSSAHTALVCVLGNKEYMQHYWLLLVALLTIDNFTSLKIVVHP